MQSVDCLTDVNWTVCAGASRALLYIEVMDFTQWTFTEMRIGESVAHYITEVTGEWSAVYSTACQ